MPESSEYGARAFEFIDRLNAVSTQDGVIDLVADALAGFGFEHFIITGLPAPYQTFEQVVVIRKWPAGWFDHYAAERFVEVDPVIRKCRESVQPFEWTEANYDPEREGRAHALMTQARDFGLKRGFSLPIHGLGHEACFSMSGADLDLTPRSKPAIHLMAMYAFERARFIAEEGRVRRDNPLTAREREVLCWAFAGKTARDTAEILGITERTVQAHVNNSMEKLGAATKTQAVGRAMQRAYISV